MKTITCECGHTETGPTEKDLMTKMESHIRNAHPDWVPDMKKKLSVAEKTIVDEDKTAM